jgi:signal transduction histidine kinase
MPNTEPHLDIDAHVVVQLGAELISDAEQALLELVKNAYDGDATRCTISIEPDWLPSDKHPWHAYLISHAKPSQRIGRIVVEDNGEGLSQQSVTKGWLLISGSLKRAEDGAKIKTGRKRTPVGDKGLGRLATMRLGDVLFLCTRTTKDKVSRTVAFAWSQFKSGSPLHDVPVVTGTGAPLRGRDHGTNVEVLGLNEPQYWESETNIRGVITKLSSLISPFRRLQDFQVNIRYNEQLRDLQALSADALNYASAKFSFVYIDGVLTSRAWFAKTLFRGPSGERDKLLYEELLADSQLPKVIQAFAESRRFRDLHFISLLNEPGGWLFSLEDKITWDDMPRDPKLPGGIDPGPFQGEIYYVLFNEPTKQSLQAAGIPVEMLQEMTTVGMLRDGFRVRMDDDWLEISKGVTSGGFFQLRPRNVIGYFEITNEHNSALIEKSDREGFVDNEAWRGFMRIAARAKKFANDALEAVRTTYDEYKKRHAGATVTSDSGKSWADDAAAALREHRAAATESLKVAKARSSSIAKTLSAVSTSIASQGERDDDETIKNIADELRDIGDTWATFQDALDEASKSASEGFGAAAQVLVTNEQLTEYNLRLIDAAAVGLSARGLTHEITFYVGMIDKGLANVRRANRGKPDKKLAEAIDKISGAVRELKKTVSSINPLLSGSRSLKDNFFVGDAVKEFIELRATRLGELKVSVQLIGGRGPYIRFAKTRFNQILENLLQNSLYWIDEHGTSNAKVRRTITIECDKNGFTWWDGAKGVREAVEESIFEPYVTDKPESRGQGLGLFLISAFMEAEKSQIYLLPERNAWGRRYKFRADLRGALAQ